MAGFDYDDVDHYDMDDMCGNCGDRFGAHNGLECPTCHLGFRLYAAAICDTPSEEKRHYCTREKNHSGCHHFQGFYWSADVKADIAAAVLPGPRKPVPVLPMEVFSTKKFNADEAWAAIVALSKGS